LARDHLEWQPIVVGAVDAAKLKVPIAEAFGLVHAAKAHERLAEGHVLGKIVLRIHQS